MVAALVDPPAVPGLSLCHAVTMAAVVFGGAWPLFLAASQHRLGARVHNGCSQLGKQTQLLFALHTKEEDGARGAAEGSSLFPHHTMGVLCLLGLMSLHTDRSTAGSCTQPSVGPQHAACTAPGARVALCSAVGAVGL